MWKDVIDFSALKTAFAKVVDFVRFLEGHSSEEPDNASDRSDFCWVGNHEPQFEEAS